MKDYEAVKQITKEIKQELQHKGSMNIADYARNSGYEIKLVRVAIRRVVRKRVGL